MPQVSFFASIILMNLAMVDDSYHLGWCQEGGGVLGLIELEGVTELNIHSIFFFCNKEIELF
jgi:hypothetical protein